MPENINLTTQQIQEMMQKIRASMENAINRNSERFFPKSEENVQEIDQSKPIEQVPQEEHAKQDWMNKPRGRGMGWFTNLSLGKEHVTMKNNGGEIN